MPLVATRGAASAQGFGEFAQQTAATYIEDVFSTWLYTGTGSARSITNGIDLSTKGGLVWIKNRNTAIYDHNLFDTSRGTNKTLRSNTTQGQITTTDTLTAFNATGFTLGADSSGYGVNDGTSNTYASWTFRKQPKFFDVVTYTGTGSAQTISHNLGSVPGVIIAKATSGTSQWSVYHRSLGKDSPIFLNLTDAAGSNANYWGTSNPTSTSFGLSGPSYDNNQNGKTYVAYLFAHNAGGFGLTGTDNVISCGSYTGNGSANGPTVALGYEPQWLLLKNASSSVDWYVVDNMRGFPNGASLFPNDSVAESNALSTAIQINATGFTLKQDWAAINASGSTYIYIAIRRGPMKTPTTGTSVYENVAYTGNGTANRQIGTSVLMDAMLLDNRDATAQSWSTYGQMFFDRLRGDDVSLATASTAAQSTGWQTYFDSDMNVGWDTGTTSAQDYLNKSGATFVSHIFRRAPGFFDVVCYAGTGVAGVQIPHNLGAPPELLIVKSRNQANSWRCYAAPLGPTQYITLNQTDAAATLSAFWNDTAPTSSVFTLGNASAINNPAIPCVAYLFASCPGVSKVGSYTGTGALQTINCGFTGGARFVLIKRTDDTGDWWVYDSARGISSGNDPYLFLNSTAAEVTGTNYVDTTSVGFQVTAAAPAGLNANGGTYIFLAVA